ncbi:MAG: pseudaminic acid synthase [Planctomycetota bacterium]
MTSAPTFAISGRPIGPGHPTYIIAELSANHGQHLDRAIELVRASAAAGADAIKIQTYTPDTITIRCERPEFRISAGTIWDGRQLHDLYAEAMTPWAWHAPIFAEAKRLGVHAFSSPFDHTAVDYLLGLNVPVWKIASFELVDLPLIRRCASTGLPIIMSTGMATRDEIDEAVAAARGAGCTQLCLLKCTSSYPTPADQVNLRTIPHLAATYGCVVGLSDHTLFPNSAGADGASVPVAAVALGAAVIEKHVTIRRSDGGPDSSFSMEPAEFAAMVRQVRAAEQALGNVSYTPAAREAGSRALRRSLYIVKAVRAGELATADNVRSIRPANGLHTRHYDAVLGRRFAADLPAGTPLTLTHLA